MRTREQIIADALRAELGIAQDNLHRARAAARRFDPEKEWGESGQTLSTIIANHQAHVDELQAAIRGGK